MSQRSLYDEPARYAEVAIPLPVTGTFAYQIPDWLEPLVIPGARVRVRFSGRPATGVVVATVDQPPAGVDPRRVRTIDDCLDRDRVVDGAMMALARRVADAYLVGIGEVLHLAQPNPGADPVAGRRVRLRSGRGGRLDARLERVRLALEAAGGDRGWVAPARVARRLPGLAAHGAIYRLVDHGVVEIADEWSGSDPGARRRFVAAAQPATEETRAATARAPAQRRVMEALVGASAPVAEAELAARLGVARGTFAALEKKGLVVRTLEPLGSDPSWSAGDDGAGTFVLTADQEQALACVDRALAAGDTRPVLLHGVTGSGKTEVYLRAARRCRRVGRGVVLLVPEIGLTPQIEARARAVLGDDVAVLHSGMAAGERARNWWRLRRGEAGVAVGPRSAVFAPVADLGLIVVDEEQDGAYKQDERPRYNGRDVAIWRAHVEGATVVLGSATPSVESYRRGRRGSWTLVDLPRRVADRALPAVELVDMRAEWKAVQRALLSRSLEEKISARLERREQALILLNRRGFASALICRACGERLECADCAVSLTLHRAQRQLVCHYCDHRRPVPESCPHCASSALHDLGFGTERLQAALTERFPSARVRRFDADQTQRRGAHGRILGEFARGEIDLLVGTQMLAKGHDFPAVTLVGVVGADAGLGVPDFRAAERTFQLLTQMAGRAGRGERGGEVLLQAHQPAHYAIDAALRHDYVGFWEREVEFRRRLGYPPFAALAVCLCRGKLAAAVREEADLLARALRDVDAPLTVLGPASPPLSRLRGRYRVQIVVKAPRREELRTGLKRALERLAARSQTPRDLVVDIDPLNLM